MVDMEKLTEQLKLHEGIRLKPYRCTAGKLTIGIGRNLDDKGITMEEAEFLLRTDIEECIEDCVKIVGEECWNRLTEPRRRVLVDMRFNLGGGSLRSFKNTLRAIREGRYTDAAAGMLASKWARQVGKRANRLSAMMIAG